MGALFSSKPPVATPNRVNQLDKAIFELKVQRDKLQICTKKITPTIAKYKEAAIKFMRNGEKEKAIMLMRKRKYQENMLNNTYAQLENIEKMTMSVEFAVIQKDVFLNLKMGTEALRTLQEEMSVDDVAQVMDDMRDGIAYVDEVNAALAGKLTPDEDEEALRELDALFPETDRVTNPDSTIVEPIDFPVIPSDDHLNGNDAFATVTAPATVSKKTPTPVLLAAS